MSLFLAADACLSWSLPSITEASLPPQASYAVVAEKSQAFFMHTNSIANSAILRNNDISLLSDLCACVHVKKKWHSKGSHSSSVSGSNHHNNAQESIESLVVSTVNKNPYYVLQVMWWSILVLRIHISTISHTRNPHYVLKLMLQQAGRKAVIFRGRDELLLTTCVLFVCLSVLPEVEVELVHTLANSIWNEL